MLLRARRMVQWYIDNSLVPSDEICALSVNMQQVYTSRRQFRETNDQDHNRAPTCSFPLNTYNLHPSNGFLASGGSWYFNTTSLPSPVLTVLVAAANNPELPKFGFPLSSSLSLSPSSSLSLSLSSPTSIRLDLDLERERDRLLLDEGDLDLESLGFREDLDGGEADLRELLLES